MRLIGKNLIFGIGLFFLFLSTPCLSQSNIINLAGSSDDDLLEIKILEQDSTHTRIEISVNGYITEDVDVDGVKNQIISIPEMVSIEEKGAPDLPQLFRTLQVPDTSVISYKIID